MATNNGIFRMRIEESPMTEAKNFTFSTTPWGGSTAVWDIPVQEVNWNHNVALIETSDEMRGLVGTPTNDGAGMYNVEVTARARVRPGMLGLLMYLITGGTVTTTTSPTADFGGQTLAASTYQHAFTWSTAAQPKTASIYFAPLNGTGWKCSGCALSTLAFTFDDAGVLVVDMSFVGMYFKADAALAFTTGFTTLKPFKRGNLTLDTNFSDTSEDATHARGSEFSFTIENPVEGFFAFGENSLYSTAVEYTDVWPKVSGSITKRNVMSADYDKFRQGTSFTTEVKFKHSDVLSGSLYPAFYLDMNGCQFTGFSPEGISNKRLISASMDWEARLASGGTIWCDAYVVNSQAGTVFTAMDAVATASCTPVAG
jgi:hypothetical protein